MKLMEWRAFEGPSVHCHRPVTEIVLDLQDLARVTTRALPDRGRILVEWFPGISSHVCGLGRTGGFVERLIEGTYYGHVLEHVALELLTLVGEEVRYGKTRLVREPGVYRVVLEHGRCLGPQAGYHAARSAMTVTEALARSSHIVPDQVRTGLEQALGEAVMGPSTRALFEAARARAIPVERIGAGSILQLGTGCHRRRLEASLTCATGVIAVDIASDKQLTKDVLARSAIPVPAGAVAHDSGQALAIAHALGFPVAIKPLNANQGKGVSVGIQSDAQVREAFAEAQAFSERVVVERHVAGRQYRFLVVGARVVAAAERIPPRVAGDGQRTVAQLVDEVNRSPERGSDHQRPLTRIPLDGPALRCLHRQGLSPRSVPAAGRLVELRDSANLSTGGSARDVTAEVSPLLVRQAVRAAAAVGLDVAGVDVVATDLGRPVAPGRGAVLEVNAAPGLRMHLFPSQGQRREVADAILERLYPPGAPTAIPVVGVTGTNGKTTVTRWIASVLAAGGRRVGMTTTDGVWIGDERVSDGDTTGPKSARTVLGDCTCEAAVLETARGGILRRGLGFEHCDVAVVTNLSSDHLGQDGIETMEELLHVKALLVETVRPTGWAVLNADDTWTLSLRSRCRGRVCLFSTRAETLPVTRHRLEGGRALLLRAGQLVAATGAREERIMPVRAIGGTWEGRLGFMVQNAMAAAGALWSLEVSMEQIRAGLAAFAGNLGQNPGRMNLYEVGAIQVLVDYGHNAAACEAVLAAARALRPGRVIAVVGAPGDRRDEDARALGRIAARRCEHVIVKEDQDLRGRRPGEVAALLLEGLRSGGLAARNTTAILREVDAVRAAINLAEPGDLVVVFYEKLWPIVDVIAAARRARRPGADARAIASPLNA